MRVGIVIHSLVGGGAESVARRWIQELAARGHEVTVFQFTPAPSRDEDTGVAVVAAPGWARSRRGLLLPLWLRGRVLHHSPEVLLSLPLFSNVIALLAFPSRRRRTPLVISERNIERGVGEARGQNYGIPQRFFRRVVGSAARRLYRHADALIAVSHPVAADAIATYRLSSRNVFVVPNPAATDDRTVSRRTPDRLHLAYAARMSAEKRPNLFLDIIAELQRRGCCVRGTMFGDGPMTPTVREAIASRGLPVELAGWRRDWTAWSDQLDCLVLPSSTEGFGNVLVEAACAGIPSVASSRALAVADAVIPGVTGELALLDTPESFADSIERAIAIPRTGRQVSLDGWFSHFSRGSSTTALLAVLERARDRGTHA